MIVPGKFLIANREPKFEFIMQRGFKYRTFFRYSLIMQKYWVEGLWVIKEGGWGGEGARDKQEEGGGRQGKSGGGGGG